MARKTVKIQAVKVFVRIIERKGRMLMMFQDKDKGVYETEFTLKNSWICFNSVKNLLTTESITLTGILVVLAIPFNLMRGSLLISFSVVKNE